VTCLACALSETSTETLVEAASPPPAIAPRPIEHGTAGGSARREFDRRHQMRQAEIEQEWGAGLLGRVVKKLSDDPQTTKAWAQGATGEERVARVLHERLGTLAVLLHDRCVPKSRANIDHLVIAAGGVWIVDAKRYSGKLEKRDVGGFFRTDVRLYVGGRDRTKVVHGLGWQVDAVRRALDGDEVPIQPALCFVGAEWAFLATPFRLDDVLIAWPTKLAELIRGAEQRLSPDDVERVARRLAERLPAK
jgi:hypothetical protein